MRFWQNFPPRSSRLRNWQHRKWCMQYNLCELSLHTFQLGTYGKYQRQRTSIYQYRMYYML